MQKWLGINNIALEIVNLNKLYKNLVSIGVDVHFKTSHMILIYSRLNGGQLKHIEVNFDSLKELRELVQELKTRYHTENTIFDAPRDQQQFLEKVNEI